MTEPDQEKILECSTDPPDSSWRRTVLSVLLVEEDELTGFEVVVTVKILTWHMDGNSSTFQSKVLILQTCVKTFHWDAKKQ